MQVLIDHQICVILLLILFCWIFILKNVMEGKKVVNMITFHVLEFFEIISLGILFYSYILIEIQSGTGLQCSYYTQLDDFWLIMTPVILLSSHFLFSWIVLWTVVKVEKLVTRITFQMFELLRTWDFFCYECV